MIEGDDVFRLISLFLGGIEFVDMKSERMERKEKKYQLLCMIYKYILVFHTESYESYLEKKAPSHSPAHKISSFLCEALLSFKGWG